MVSALSAHGTRSVSVFVRYKNRLPCAFTHRALSAFFGYLVFATKRFSFTKLFHKTQHHAREIHTIHTPPK